MLSQVCYCHFQGYTADPVLHRGTWNSNYNVLIGPCCGLAHELSGEDDLAENLRIVTPQALEPEVREALRRHPDRHPLRVERPRYFSPRRGMTPLPIISLEEDSDDPPRLAA